MASLADYLRANPNNSTIQPPKPASSPTTNPSASSPALKTTAAQTYIQNQKKGQAEAQTKFDANISSGKDISGNTVVDNSVAPAKPATPAAPSAYDTAKADYTKAYTDYINALNPSKEYTDAQNTYNDYTANQNKSIAGLAGKDAGVPLSIVRGQQEKLLGQTQPEAQRLQNAIGIAQNSDKARAGVGLANVSLREKLLGLEQSPAEQSKANQDLLKSNTDIANTQANTAKTVQETNNPKLDTSVVDTDSGQLLVNNQTGKTIANLGKKTSSSASLASSVSDALLSAINSGTIDPNKLNSRTVGIYNAIANAGVDAVNASANAQGQIAAIKDLTTYKSTAQRTLNTIDANLPLVANLADSVNRLGTPILDSYVTGGKALLTNDQNVIKYVNSLKTLRSEYAQMLSKGGVATEGDKSEAAKAIPAGLSGDAYRALGDQLKLEANNIIGASDSAIKSANSKTNSNNSSNNANNDPLGLR